MVKVRALVNLPCGLVAGEIYDAVEAEAGCAYEWELTIPESARRNLEVPFECTATRVAVYADEVEVVA